MLPYQVPSLRRPKYEQKITSSRHGCVHPVGCPGNTKASDTPASGLQEVKPELEKESAPSEKVYEKDDFFDQLSCEALERLNVGSDGAAGQPGQPGKLPLRTRFAEQRKLDIETFGGTGIARRNNYGRGGGRRGRGVRVLCHHSVTIPHVLWHAQPDGHPVVLLTRLHP